ncbi:MAG: RNase A-like domain-containing protein [Alphaproteobacteria bacterium]
MSRGISDRELALSRLRWEHAGLRMDIAMLRLQLAFETAFNPSQPRVPAGHPDGGQWTDGDNGVIPVADNDRPGEDRYLNQHIINRHVGKSEAELIARIQRSQYRSYFISLGIDRNGSFASEEDARDLIKRTIVMNPDAVARVASGQSAGEFLIHRFGFPTGKEAYVDPPDIDLIRIRKTYQVGVFIVRDTHMVSGYRIRNAFPRNYHPRIGR